MIPSLFPPDPLIRLPFYVALGLITEVLFTATADLIRPSFLNSWRVKQNGDIPLPDSKRDPRGVGYTFIWMLPIYALLITIEPLSLLLHDWPVWLRGLVYLPLFWFIEYLGGAGIRRLIGRCPWDYSYSKYSFHGYIRWDFAPLWYSFSILVDLFSQKLILLTPCLKNLL